MYVDAIIEKDKNQILVSERNAAGQRVLVTHPTRYVVYWPSERGKYTSIFGTKLERYQTSKEKEFKREVALLPRVKLHESDINPIFRCLHDHYKDAPTPDLHVGFLDIETDFDPLRGFSSPDDAFSPITAISIYLNWIEKNFTLVIKPKGMSTAAAQQIIDQFEDTVLCENEKELLEVFLALIDDVDVLSGWNCINLNEYVHCEDRLLSLKNITTNQKLKNGQTVIDTHKSGLKKNNHLITIHGHKLELSDEHVIPVYSKEPLKYKCPSTLFESRQELNVRDIKQLMKKNQDVFVELHTVRNNNEDLTYKKLILENLDVLINCNIDIIIDDRKIKKKYQKELGYKSTNYVLTYKKVKHLLTNDQIKDYLNSKNIHGFYINAKSKAFRLDITQIIQHDALKILGFVYTDGFYSNYDKCFGACNKNDGIISNYNILLKNLNIYNKWKLKNQDKIFYTTFSGQTVIGLLLPLIYTFNQKYTKQLNTELLSRLSFDQFNSFYSGMIDGDGSVDKKSITLCNYNDDAYSLSALLSWNGIYASVRKNYIRIPTIVSNLDFIKNLQLSHSLKNKKLSNISITNTSNNTSRKKLHAFHMNNIHLIKISKIIETDELVEMGDIQTSDHYFICNGVKVHNSEAYDLPYIHNRIVQVMGKDETRRLCLWNKLPRKREYESYGRETITYDLVGRVHLDYLQLYRKHTYHEMHSYRLDFVGEYEVDEKKTQYEGTLDALYNNDFRKFIEYNKQDVMLLVKIDKKLKFIELANNLAHTNCVLFQTTMGAVALIDQAIVNAAHDMDLMVPTRIRETQEEKEARWEEEESVGGSVVGAYVADPKQGMHDWIGGVDINSLYPSTIRALNMSPESIVGQIRPEMTDKLIAKRVKEEKRSFADAWNNMFGTLEYEAVMAQNQTPLQVDFEDGSAVTVTGKEVYDLVFKSGKKLTISANGTIFSYDKAGLIPGVLARWYAERKDLQKEARKWALMADEAVGEEKSEFKKKAVFYDQRQLIKKILLNSLYGAVGNPGSRWFDPRVAQSTTLSGRCIVRHMQGKINEIITGNYDYMGESIIYGDSVTGDTKILTDDGEITISQMFNQCLEKSIVNEKEYGLWPQHRVLGFNAYEDNAVISVPSHVMRHKTKKKIYEIELENGKLVKVTEDHSIMVDRDGFLLEVKPTEIKETDQIICLKR